MSPLFDPWEAEPARRLGRHVLSSIEITVTNRCNLRCRHCAVGEVLSATDPEPLPLDLLFRRLDEVPGLRTLSITGGEPSASPERWYEYVLPLMRYARGRGILTQVNTNLTFPLERYRDAAPFVDVFHITWNYGDAQDFHRIVWGHLPGEVLPAVSERLFERLVANVRALTGAGAFVSAESLVSRETAPRLGQMNRIIAGLGCRRHEVHPLYPVDWGADLAVLSLDEFRGVIDRFLDERDPDLWVLFGTFPFLACSPTEADRTLLQKVWQAPNTSVRNCPDGRCRLNVNAFSGDVTVTDFAEIPPMGRIQDDGLADVFDRWQRSPAFAAYDCYCPAVRCTGPNLIVANLYYPGETVSTRKSWIATRT